MDVRLALNPDWQRVYTLPAGTDLRLGSPALRQRPAGTVAAALLTAAADTADPYLCYAWTSSQGVHYIGSVTRPWQHARGRTPLQCRVERYLHRAGRTNVRIMDEVATLAQREAVTLRVLRYTTLRFGNTDVPPAAFALAATLVLAVEHLLIAAYKRDHQCAWNLTGVDPGLV